MDLDLTIAPAEGPDALATVRGLFVAYAQSLGFSLCFQGFDEELATLPGKYAPPGGALLLAGTHGVVGVRPLGDGIAEMKRLYVAPPARGQGLGQALALAAIASARGAGHRAIRLDTLNSMKEAVALYRDLGFREIPRYYDNPLEGAHYFELAL